MLLWWRFKKAHRWNPKHPVVGWIVGILVKKAQKAREKSFRQSQAEPWQGEDTLDGLQYALNDEVREEVERALETLPAADANLLAAALERQARPTELARAEGITPGAMRVRIHRAMEKLRNALPASLAWGLAGTLGLRGVQSVREHVLQTAIVHKGKVGTTSIFALSKFYQSKAMQPLLITGVAALGSFVIWQALHSAAS